MINAFFPILEDLLVKGRHDILNTVESLLHKLLDLMNRGIERFWVHPLESNMIPRLESSQQTLLRDMSLSLTTWLANLGRLIGLNLRVEVIRWVGSDWSITYIGDGSSLEYLSTILFQNKPTVDAMPRVFLWQVPALIKRFSGEGNLVVCELNEIFRWLPTGPNTSFTVPPWIKQVLEGIDRPIEDILASMNRSTRRNIRRLEKHGFTYSITQKKEDFDYFYYRMYLPTIKSRHEGQGMIMEEYQSVYKDFLKGGLGLLKNGHHPVCGGIFQLDDDTFIAQLGGVLDGDSELIKKRVNIALFWSELNFARAKGAQRYDFGSCRAQTSNGVYEFKRQIGTRVFKHKFVYARWNFYAQVLPDKLRRHLNELGLITCLDGRCYRLLLVDSPGLSSAMDINQETVNAEKFGLEGLILVDHKGAVQVISSPN